MSYVDRYLCSSLDDVTIVEDRFFLAWPARVDAPIRSYPPATKVHRAVPLDDQRECSCATYVVRPSPPTLRQVGEDASNLMRERHQSHQSWPAVVATNLNVSPGTFAFDWLPEHDGIADPLTLTQADGWLALDVPEGPPLAKYRAAGTVPVGVMAYIFHQLALTLHTRALRKVQRLRALPSLSEWAIALSFDGDVVLPASLQEHASVYANMDELLGLFVDVASAPIAQILSAHSLDRDALAHETEKLWRQSGAMMRDEVARYAQSLFATEYTQVLELRERLVLWGDEMSAQFHAR